MSIPSSVRVPSRRRKIPVSSFRVGMRVYRAAGSPRMALLALAVSHRRADDTEGVEIYTRMASRCPRSDRLRS